MSGSKYDSGAEKRKRNGTGMQQELILRGLLLADEDLEEERVLSKMQMYR